MRKSRVRRALLKRMDSNVQKAEELEASLRRWKQRLHLSSSSSSTAAVYYNDTVSLETRHELADTSGQRRADSEQVVAGNGGQGERDQEQTVPDSQHAGGGGEVGGAWHQLTSYIVGLERRVQVMEGEATGLAAGRVPTTVALCSPDTQTTRDVPRTDLEHTVAGERHGIDLHHLLHTDDSYSHVLLLTFSWLTTAELCTVSQVCHRWREVAQHPHLWQKVTISNTTITSQDLVRLGRLCSGTHSLTLHGLMPEMAGPDEELHSYIARQRGSLEPGLAALLSASPHLTSLAVTQCNLMLTERVLWLASVHCPQLRHLSYTSDEFPPTPAALWALSNGCRGLQSLYLPPYPNSPFVSHFSDACLSTIARGWPGILQLTVGGPGISPAGLRDIAVNCQSLEVLRVEYGPQISSTDVASILSSGGLSRLHTLSLIFTPLSPKALHRFSSHLQKLNNITLHISPNTYFPGSSTDPVILKKFHQIHSNFQELERSPEMNGMFHLHLHRPNNTVLSCD